MKKYPSFLISFFFMTSSPWCLSAEEVEAFFTPLHQEFNKLEEEGIQINKNLQELLARTAKEKTFFLDLFNTPSQETSSENVEEAPQENSEEVLQSHPQEDVFHNDPKMIKKWRKEVLFLANVVLDELEVYDDLIPKNFDVENKIKWEEATFGIRSELISLITDLENDEVPHQNLPGWMTQLAGLEDKIRNKVNELYENRSFQHAQARPQEHTPASDEESDSED